MEELIKVVSERAGISPEMSKKAVDVVMEYLQNNSSVVDGFKTISKNQTNVTVDELKNSLKKFLG